jgi:hypothetical protein
MSTVRVWMSGRRLPHRLEQVPARLHPPAALGEGHEQLVLGGREVHAVPVDRRRSARRGRCARAHREHVAPARRRAGRRPAAGAPAGRARGGSRPRAAPAPCG